MSKIICLQDRSRQKEGRKVVEGKRNDERATTNDGAREEDEMDSNRIRVSRTQDIEPPESDLTPQGLGWPNMKVSRLIDNFVILVILG